jgi:glycosyltransferase involved in cell wall biosynthesis
LKSGKTAVALPIHVGVWCDYGVTLTPTEGIGVFVVNLVDGLLSLAEPIEVTLLVRPGEQHLVDSLQRRYPGRLHVVPPKIPGFQAAVRTIARTIRKAHGLQRRLSLWRQVFNLPKPVLASSKIAATLWRVSKRIPFFGSLLYQLECIFNPVIVSQNAGCDVWLIPSDRLRYPLPVPSVLVIHDLVHVHYPDAVPDDVRAELNHVVPLRAAEATLCACMSRFILETDLRGILKLPEEKLRMIRPAPPSELSIPHSAFRIPHYLSRRPYLFYPAAFRSYKNHAALLDALAVLRHQHGEDSYDLVFTGIRKIPKELNRRIRELGLSERVHTLGCVDRQMLAALYSGAFATIVPSLYEQGSFPIYEALHWGCPVACSNIPSLIEQCQPLRNAMIYFDPRAPEDIARAILRIRDDREAIRARQQAAKPGLWQRTWQDAARDWLMVFRQAIEMSGGQDPESLAA